MALGGEAGLGRAVLVFLERAFAQHLEQVGTRQRRLLLPEQAALAVARAQQQRLEALAGVRVAQAALGGKQLRELLTQQHAREGLVVLPLLVTLRVRKLGKHHFGGAAVALGLHQGLGTFEALLDASAFGVAVGGRFLGLADPVKSPVLAQVVDHARPFERGEQAIESLAAQFPGTDDVLALCVRGVGFGEGRTAGEQLGVGDQAFALEQACQLREPPCASVQAAAQQPGLAAGEVERVALLGCFGLVKATHAQVNDALLVQYRPSDGCNANVQAKNILTHESPLAILVPDCGYPG